MTVVKGAKKTAKQPSRKHSRVTRSWQLQTAKARFSEVFRRARTEGPQWVTRQGKETVVILPAEEFERLSRRSTQPENLVDFLRTSPLMGIELDLDRPRDVGRKVELERISPRCQCYLRTYSPGPSRK